MFPPSSKLTSRYIDAVVKASLGRQPVTRVPFSCSPRASCCPGPTATICGSETHGAKAHFVPLQTLGEVLPSFMDGDPERSGVWRRYWTNRYLDCYYAQPSLGEGENPEEFFYSYFAALEHHAIRLVREREALGGTKTTGEAVDEMFLELLEKLPDDLPRRSELELPLAAMMHRHTWPLMSADQQQAEIDKAQEEALAVSAEITRRAPMGSDRDTTPPLVNDDCEANGAASGWSGYRSSESTEVKTRLLPKAFQIRTPRDAEVNAARWTEFMGFFGAKVTPVGPDGGIDVVSGGSVAQVKAEASLTGSQTVQQLVGASIAGHRGKVLQFFVSSGYTKAAIEFAGHAEVELYTYDFAGFPSPVNTLAATRLSGLGWSARTGWENV